MVLLECTICHTIFFRRISEVKKIQTNRGPFCSTACKDKWFINAENKKILWNYQEWVIKVCKTCGAEYKKARRFLTISHYCSIKCKHIGQSRFMSKNNPSKRLVKYISCKSCGEYFSAPKGKIARNKHGVFCSYECWHEYLLNHPWIGGLWKGGGHIALMGKEWYRQRKKALKRDEYACQACGAAKGSTTVRIEVHHIIIYRASKSHDLTNLITLCHPCHMKVHILTGWQADTQSALSAVINPHSEVDAGAVMETAGVV